MRTQETTGANVRDMTENTPPAPAGERGQAGEGSVDLPAAAARHGPGTGQKRGDCGELQPSAIPISPLWRVADLARFLQKSERWLWSCLRLPDDAPGSIPCCRLGAAARKSTRFDPAEIRAWLTDGCPPVATFRAWNKKRA